MLITVTVYHKVSPVQSVHFSHGIRRFFKKSTAEFRRSIEKRLHEGHDRPDAFLRERKRDGAYNTANLQLSLRQLASIERCTTAVETGPAFFIVLRRVLFCFSFLFFPVPPSFSTLTRISWSRVRSGLDTWPRCHGHVHAIATSESHAHRLSDEFPLNDGTHAERLSQ